MAKTKKYKLNAKKLYLIPVLVMAVGFAGLASLNNSSAALPYVSAEPEQGALSGRVNNVSEINASNNSAVLFDSALSGPISMQMISFGKPAFASSGLATNGNDLNYNNSWSSGSSGWLAYDLSTVPVDKRQSIYVAWHSAWDDGLTVESGNGLGCPAWSGRPYLSNYTVEANSAPGGTSAPTTGWQVLTTVNGNQQLSKQHYLQFSGYNWIRLKGTSTTSIDLNFDVADASMGVTDGWIFLGDSITTRYAGHSDMGAGVKSFTNLISNGTAGKFVPIQQNGAIACIHTRDALVWMDSLLDSTPAKYVTLNTGTNDSWGGGGNPDDYFNTLEDAILKIQAKGRIAVIAKIPWPNNGGVWESKVEAFNAKIDQLYLKYPDIIKGPDLYTLSKGKTNWFSGSGDVHPNDLGASEFRKAWANSALQNIYGM